MNFTFEKIGLFCVMILLVGLYLLALVQDLKSRRRARKAMEELTKRNRGLMDHPGWEKQPWQHDATVNKADVDK